MPSLLRFNIAPPVPDLSCRIPHSEGQGSNKGFWTEGDADTIVALREQMVGHALWWVSFSSLA